MTRKEELLGEYADLPRRNNNMGHIFGNLLAGISHADWLLADSTFCKNYRAKKKIQKLLQMVLRYITAYKLLLDDFPEFRKHEMDSNNAGTPTKYIEAKYLELRGEPFEKEKEE